MSLPHTNKAFKNTFEIVGDDQIPLFIKKIADVKPDYVVPVMKKGCKLLRHYVSRRGGSSGLSLNIKYRDYFKYADVDLHGKKIAVIDDATKYTSMLYKYRSFFEERGAEVETYSFVGQKMLVTGEREQFDKKAHIFKFLDESTYQEYILQQSHTLSSEDYFFDVDDIVVRINIKQDRFNDFINSLDRIGDIEFVNDIYTPKYIDKISVNNVNYNAVLDSFPDGVNIDVMQKIRLAYNSRSEMLTIAPLTYPIWDAKRTVLENLFEKIEIELPYVADQHIDNGAIFFDMVFCFQVYFLGYFLKCFSIDFSELKSYRFLRNDLKAYVGERRAKTVFDSCRKYLASVLNDETKSNLAISKKEKIAVPQHGESSFNTIKDVMDELRGQYEALIKKSTDILNIRYFMSYEEIMTRYEGTASIMKWFDVLSDRGVLVTRNYHQDDIYYRACRSGEGNYDETEKRTEALLPIAIDSCGDEKIVKGKKIGYTITSTYLNKVLANFIYDYPSEEYDFHSMLAEPNYFGPYVYIENKLGGDYKVPLHKIYQISQYCNYLQDSRQFFACDIRDPNLKDKFDSLFGQHDEVPYTEITTYFGFLKQVHREAKKDKFLNQLIICRDQDTYYKYVYFNLKSAFSIINSAKMQIDADFKEEGIKTLDVAGIHIKSAREKLSYNQSNTLKFIKDLPVDLVYDRAQQKIVDSFIPFTSQFKKLTVPTLCKVASLELMLENLMLYELEFKPKYWHKFINEYKKQHHIEFEQIDELETIIETSIANHKWDENDYKLNVNVSSIIVSLLIEQLTLCFTQELKQPEDDDSIRRKQREYITSSINHIKRIVHEENLDQLVLVYYNYAGYKNKDIKKDDLRVIEIIQDYVSKQTNGKLLYGANGGNESGLLIAENEDVAVKFSKDLITQINNIGNITIRFGCSIRNLKRTKLSDELITEAIKEAKEIDNQVINTHVFAMSNNSYEELKTINREKANDYIESTLKGNSFYVNKTISHEYSDFIYDGNVDKDFKGIGIITVLPEEYSAMKSMMINTRSSLFRGQGAGNRYLLGKISALGGEMHDIVLARTIGPGNNKAAIRAEQMLQHYPNLKIIFMVGIAGGIPLMPDDAKGMSESQIDENDIRLGDIVVADSIIQYDFIKDKFQEIQHTGLSSIPSSEALEAFQQLQILMEEDSLPSLPWNKYIDKVVGTQLPRFARPNPSKDILYNLQDKAVNHVKNVKREEKYPKVFKGKIGSANEVLKNPVKRQQLKREHNVIAVEMETSGISDTTWVAAKPYFAVRGISDYCDGHKNDDWHRYAALTAAAFTRAIIEQMQK